MKKNISLIFTLALLLAVSFGCKVGDEDPASLASRDGRLVATWNLTAAEVSQVRQNPNDTTITTESYDGTTWWTTMVRGQNTEKDTIGYALQLTIEKGGTATIAKTTTTKTGKVEKYTDIPGWSWMDADKNKSKIIIDSDGNATVWEIYGIWEVLRLSNKELILYKHSKTMETDPDGKTSTDETTYKFTFEAE